jgi:hypothetical protein
MSAMCDNLGLADDIVLEVIRRAGGMGPSVSYGPLVLLAGDVADSVAGIRFPRWVRWADYDRAELQRIKVSVTPYGPPRTYWCKQVDDAVAAARSRGLVWPERGYGGEEEE